MFAASLFWARARVLIPTSCQFLEFSVAMGILFFTVPRENGQKGYLEAGLVLSLTSK